jgi:hypothetical protein
MVSIAECSNCGGEIHVPLGQELIELNFKSSDWCERCRISSQNVRCLYFCCIQCLKDYVNGL